MIDVIGPKLLTAVIECVAPFASDDPYRESIYRRILVQSLNGVTSFAAADGYSLCRVTVPTRDQADSPRLMLDSKKAQDEIKLGLWNAEPECDAAFPPIDRLICACTATAAAPYDIDPGFLTLVARGCSALARAVGQEQARVTCQAPGGKHDPARFDWAPPEAQAVFIVMPLKSL